VSLRDTRALRDWVLATSPSDDIWHRVHLWIVSLDHSPWRYPSYPLEDRSERPNYEVRRAVLDDAQVVVEYKRIYNGEVVDLWSVQESGG
jgi:hypothetical protein